MTHEIIGQYNQIMKDKRAQYTATYRSKPGVREKESQYALKKYHDRKVKQSCDICNVSTYYIERHKLSKKHLRNSTNPIEVICEKFSVVKPIVEDLEKATEELQTKIVEIDLVKQEVTTIKDSIKHGTVPSKYIEPIDLSAVKKHGFRSKKVSFIS
jgi:signal recognition particle GTPase